MHFTSLAIFAGAVASASAAALAPRAGITTYTLTAESDDPKINNGVISARYNKLWVSLPESIKDAECGQAPNVEWESPVATVFLKKAFSDQLFLYHGSDSPQQFVVNYLKNYRSNLSYTYYSHGNGAFGAWAIASDSQRLSFDGKQFLACAQPDGSYSLSVWSSNSSPKDKDCSLIYIRATEKPNPVPCEYSDEPLTEADLLKLANL
ncbi:hypothetical protein B0J18DRAFT_455805 [Chaetomium sp. MPI-SDFR-AT-0129]|nr:hypothetical protein B0J18DRAFT_455805 [Chaetomium sp. MPI-SDFR-AT-0129]